MNLDGKLVIVPHSGGKNLVALIKGPYKKEILSIKSDYYYTMTVVNINKNPLSKEPYKLTTQVIKPPKIRVENDYQRGYIKDYNFQNLLDINF